MADSSLKSFSDGLKLFKHVKVLEILVYHRYLISHQRKFIDYQNHDFGKSGVNGKDICEIVLP